MSSLSECLHLGEGFIAITRATADKGSRKYAKIHAGAVKRTIFHGLGGVLTDWTDGKAGGRVGSWKLEVEPERSKDPFLLESWIVGMLECSSIWKITSLSEDFGLKKHSNSPTIQHSNTPTIQHSNTFKTIQSQGQNLQLPTSNIQH